MSPLHHTRAAAQFSSGDLVCTTDAQMDQERAVRTSFSTGPCCDLSLLLVAELAAFQVCTEHAARYADLQRTAV
jgi:hypothetical protein